MLTHRHTASGSRPAARSAHQAHPLLPSPASLKPTTRTLSTTHHHASRHTQHHQPRSMCSSPLLIRNASSVQARVSSVACHAQQPGPSADCNREQPRTAGPKPARSPAQPRPRRTGGQRGPKPTEGGIVPSSKHTSGSSRKRTREEGDEVQTNADAPLAHNSRPYHKQQESSKGDGRREERGQPPSKRQRQGDAGTPALKVFSALYSLAERIEKDKKDSVRYEAPEREAFVRAGDTLINQLLGEDGGHSSSSSTAPVQRFKGKELSLTAWALSKLVSIDSRVCNSSSSSMRELVDAIAVAAVQGAIDDPAYACMHWSRLLYSISALGIKCRDSAAVQQLFDVAAQRFPEMLHQKQPCPPQNIANPIWAFAKAEYRGSLKHLVSQIKVNLGRLMQGANPQNWSNLLWGLATLKDDGNADLGDSSNVSAITAAGAAAMEQLSDRAAPQALANTLWALAKLGWQPDTSIINQLVSAFTQRISIATPQALSNTLWAMKEFDWYDAAAIRALAVAMTQQSSAIPQHLSNTLQALCDLRWFDAAIHSQLMSRLLQIISSSDKPGQHFSNALFSCGLSTHFDSSVDALAAWGSKQDLQQWTEQNISTSLSAWAMLTASAAGADTSANMRGLAQHLFAEADRRGIAGFQERPDWERDMGKLASAHWEAQRVGLPGITDSKLLQTAEEDTEERQQAISKENSSITSKMTAALQGHYEVQAALVHGYHALQVSHPSCPRGIVLDVTVRDRDYLRHPAGRVYGKTLLRWQQMRRCCDGIVLCDEAELRGGSEKVRSVLLQRLEKVVMKER